MLTVIVFAAFMALMLISVILNITMIVPLAAGLVMFFLLALRGGARPRPLCVMALRGAADALVVVRILLLIGCLTGLWRSCGTISFITYYGVVLTPPHAFVLAAFLLSSLMSYLLGTSFGVAATAGVILMTIALAGGVDPVVTGGAILSGVYFGDRASPASSSASLTANVTKTDHRENIKTLLRTSIVPMALCVVFYGALSVPNPLSGGGDNELLRLFAREFSLSPWCLVPAAVLLILAFCGVRMWLVMAIDITVSFALSMLVQGTGFMQTLRSMLLGFVPQNAALSDILSGGGLRSMLNICVMLLLSSACSGVFDGTGMLSGVEGLLLRLAGKIGRFPAMAAASAGVSAVFCNQTIGIIMTRQLMSRAYGQSDGEKREMMLDIEDSIVVIAAFVPWCIAASVPLHTLGCTAASLPFALLLYATPICHYIIQLIRRRQEKCRTTA